MGDINQRINIIAIELFEDNNSRFAKKMGTNEANIRNYRNKTEPKIEIINKIVSELDISYEWLLSGKEEMYPKNLMSTVSEPVVKYGTKKEGISLISTEEIAGYAMREVQEYEMTDVYNIPDFQAKGAQFLIRASDSAMYSKYTNGDLLACRPVTDTSFFQWGKIYVLTTEQGAIVKRIFPCENDPDFLECHSDDTEHYPPFKIHKSSVKRASIVVGVVCLED